MNHGECIECDRPVSGLGNYLLCRSCREWSDRIESDEEE